MGFKEERTMLVKVACARAYMNVNERLAGDDAGVVNQSCVKSCNRRGQQFVRQLGTNEDYKEDKDYISAGRDVVGVGMKSC